VTLSIRTAAARDAAAMAAIYNSGIDERQSTFETAHRSAADVLGWLSEAERFPVLVGETGDGVAGFARVSAYSAREAYRGVGECQVYVDPRSRRRGLGARLLEAICDEAERRGYWKLIGRLFTTNEASVELVRRSGFRVVGVHRRHGRLDGDWRDVLVVERLLGPASG
jgi:L-amino acid N-acyltransferase YncA